VPDTDKYGVMIEILLSFSDMLAKADGGNVTIKAA